MAHNGFNPAAHAISLAALNELAARPNEITEQHVDYAIIGEIARGTPTKITVLLETWSPIRAILYVGPWKHVARLQTKDHLPIIYFGDHETAQWEG